MLLFTIHCSLFTISCTQDAYDKGEGKYSRLTGDFVEAYTNGQKQIERVITDDGSILTLSDAVAPKWAKVPDSLYRCILYYNKVKIEYGEETVDLVSISQVPCPKITPLRKLDKAMKTDPVKFESAWVSKSGKYLNLSLYVLTGTADDDKASQTLAIVEDTLMVNPDSKRTSYLRLYHDQGGIPEYYSSSVYTSIPVHDMVADSVRISINTYQGEVVKTLKINPNN